MRISKLSPLAVAMAGALALAACGGGDNMSGEGDGDEDNVRTPAAGSGGYRPVTITGGFTLDDENENDAGTIRTTDVAYFGAEGTGVAVTCTDPNGCAWEVRNGILMARGTFTAALWAAPAVPAATGNTAQPTNVLDPLSDAVLLEALKVSTTPGKVATPWTTDAEGLATKAAAASKNTLKYTYPGTDPARHIALTVEGKGGNIYWGHWHRYTEDAVNPGKKTQETRGTVYGGAKRYDAKPDADVAAASYSGNVHLFYKSGASGEWDSATIPGSTTAGLDLHADFKAGMIGGEIKGVEAAIVGHAPANLTANDYDITLKDTAIGSDGTFGDTASFKKLGNTFQQDGDWDGKFFNDAVGPGRAVNTDNAPGFVAGQFSVTSHTRAAQRTEDLNAQNTAPPGFTHDLTVHGAFGDGG